MAFRPNFDIDLHHRGKKEEERGRKEGKEKEKKRKRKEKREEKEEKGSVRFGGFI